MSTRKPTGGPAYPHDVSIRNTMAPGLTIRDRFAMAALQGIMADGPPSVWSPEMVAEEAYKLADAMLEERNK